MPIVVFLIYTPSSNVKSSPSLTTLLTFVIFWVLDDNHSSGLNLHSSIKQTLHLEIVKLAHFIWCIFIQLMIKLKQNTEGVSSLHLHSVDFSSSAIILNSAFPLYLIAMLLDYFSFTWHIIVIWTIVLNVMFYFQCILWNDLLIFFKVVGESFLLPRIILPYPWQGSSSMGQPLRNSSLSISQQEVWLPFLEK